MWWRQDLFLVYSRTPQSPAVKIMPLFVWSFYWRMKIPKCRGRAVRRELGLSGGRGFKKKREREMDQPKLILKQSYFNSLSRNLVPLFISVLTKEKPIELIIINISLKTNPYFLWWWHGHSTSSGNHFTRLEKSKTRFWKAEAETTHHDYLLLFGCQLSPHRREGVTEASHGGRRSLFPGFTLQFPSHGYRGYYVFNYW